MTTISQTTKNATKKNADRNVCVFFGGTVTHGNQQRNQWVLLKQFQHKLCVGVRLREHRNRGLSQNLFL